MKKLFTLLVFLPLFSNAQIINTFAGDASSFSGDGGPATIARLNLPTGVAMDAVGNIYIADPLNNRVRMIGVSGIITTIAGNSAVGYGGDGGPATDAQLNNPFGVAVDASGNVYFADMYNNCIRMINTSGMISSVAGSLFTGGYSGDGGPATAAGLSNPVAVVVDAAGNFYIVDQGNEVIRKVDASGTITTFAGSYSGYGGDGGPATSAQLNNPAGVAVDAAGNVYIADELNARIRKVNTAGIITTVAGNGILGFSGDSGAATLAELYQPTGVGVDGAGDMYIADEANNRIRQVTTAGLINTIGGDGIGGFSGDGGAATSAKMLFPSAVTTDVAGNVFVADESNNRIRKIDTSGVISTIAGSGVAAYGDGGPATAAQVNLPQDMAFDAFGNKYISDYGHSLIRKVDAAGIITTVAGNGISGYSGDGSPATSASLSANIGIATDNSGNIYVCASGCHRIRKIDPSGVITTICGNGIAGSSGDGGPATAAMITNPQFIALDLAGNIYFSCNATLVRKINTSGIISTVAGNGMQGFSGDGGPATAGELYDPLGVVVDSSGNLYIADEWNNRIRRVDTSGIITTIIGNGTLGYSGDGGPASAAELYYPVGASIDNAGNFYTSDHLHRVRRVDLTGVITTVAGNGTPGYTGDGGPATAAELRYPATTKPDNHGHLYIADCGNNAVRILDGLPIVPSYIAHIDGMDSVCVGSAITLTDSTAYGAWSNGGSSAATVGTDGTVTGVAAGTAVITYVAGGSYTTTTVNVVPCVTTEVRNAGSSANEISIYPNPAKTQVTVQSTIQPINNITIINLVGQNVYSGIFNAKNATIDITDIAPGVYFVKTNGTDVKKFVKE